jgi:hypothetical protein
LGLYVQYIKGEAAEQKKEVVFPFNNLKPPMYEPVEELIEVYIECGFSYDKWRTSTKLAMNASLLIWQAWFVTCFIKVIDAFTFGFASWGVSEIGDISAWVCWFLEKMTGTGYIETICGFIKWVIDCAHNGVDTYVAAIPDMMGNGVLSLVRSMGSYVPNFGGDFINGILDTNCEKQTPKTIGFICGVAGGLIDSLNKTNEYSTLKGGVIEDFQKKFLNTEWIETLIDKFFDKVPIPSKSVFDKPFLNSE